MGCLEGKGHQVCKGGRIQEGEWELSILQSSLGALQETPAKGPCEARTVSTNTPQGANPSCTPGCADAGRHSNDTRREYRLDAKRSHFPECNSSAPFPVPHLEVIKGVGPNLVSHSPSSENVLMLIAKDPNYCQREQNPTLSVQSFLASLCCLFFFSKSMSFLNYITAKKHLKNSGTALLFYQTFSPLVFPHNCCHPLACQRDVGRILSARQLSR